MSFADPFVELDAPLTARPWGLGDFAAALRRHGPSLIFCESMSDVGLADSELTDAERARLDAAGFFSMDHLRDAFFDAIEATPEHRYQLLMKRPDVLLDYFAARGRAVPSSCWIGTTIGHPSSLRRLSDLHAFRALGARILFISAEPLLGDLVAAGLRLDGINWCIVGGESGTHVPRALERALVCRTSRWEPRTWGIQIVRALRDEAARAGCAFFFKQWGGPRPDSGGRTLDGVEHDGMPVHVPGAMPERRGQLGHATAALARKRLPVVEGP